LDSVDAVFTANGTGTSVGLNVGSGKTLAVAGTLTSTGTSSFSAGTTIQGLTVGRGAGAVATNTAVGASGALGVNTTGANDVAVGAYALQANTTGSQNVGVGQGALFANTTGSDNTAIGFQPLAGNTTGGQNVAIGRNALAANTTASNNTAVGYQAGYTGTTAAYNTFVGSTSGYSITTGTNNVAIGREAGYSLSTGVGNTFIGGGVVGSQPGSGYDITTGSKNTIVGNYRGNQDSLDIRTASNYVVLSDGDGNRQITMKEGQTLALDSAVPNAGTGITFPATQSASSDANTLDDYEEGSWTPTFTFGGTAHNGTYSNQSATYTKVGRLVTVTGIVGINSAGTATGDARITGLPFTAINQTGNGVTLGLFNGFSALTGTAIFGDGPTNNALITLYTSNGTISAITKTNFSTGGSNYIEFTFSYFSA
jgi:hypothetical protein